MSELKFYKCAKCGEVVYQVAKGSCTPQCCGEPMVELTANTTDAATEKHVPALSVDGTKLVVKVGEVAHPMLDEHYINFVALERADGSVTFKYLKPGEAPEATFCKPSQNATVYEYCNLHGLWKAEYTA